ncbi:MAG: aconitase X catalytic domain-containing protein [Chloroflexota bacterium]
MKLSREEEAMLGGKLGYPVQKSMEILVALGEIYEAEKMVPVTHAHLVGFLVREGVRPFVEEMAAKGARFIIPATANFVSFDLQRWREMGIPEEYHAEQMALLKAYEQMGAIISPTCAPYQVGHAPGLGEHVSWAESSAVIFANSVLGARTNREGGPVPLAAAITGRTPFCGYHLDEKRWGEVRVVVTTELRGNTDFATLGYFTGGIVQERSPVFTGITGSVSRDQLKFLGAALATSGAVTLFHVAGVTPEAPTEAAAFGGKKPDETIEFGRRELEQTAAELSAAAGNGLDMVVIGCPHASINEIKTIAGLLEGRRVHSGVAFWVLTSVPVKAYAERAGYARTLAEAGVQIICETCPLVMPDDYFPQHGHRTFATNSAKMAFYLRTHNVMMPHYGPLERCVDAAVSGVWR